MRIFGGRHRRRQSHSYRSFWKLRDEFCMERAGASAGAHPFRLRVKECEIRRLQRSYSEAAEQPDVPFAIVGSAGFLEISVRCSSAAREMKIAVGDLVKLVAEDGDGRSERIRESGS